VQVELFEAEVEDLAIPETAFTVNEEGKRTVTLIRDGKAMPTEIELAPEGGREVRASGWVRVVKGLQPGDAVAIENGYALPEGTSVTVLPPK
jgi:multidrug efflux pump subunit AcrA (membrane-fusion protein)